MAAKFELKSNAKGQYSFNLKASNGQVIGSSQMYKAAAARDAGIDRKHLYTLAKKHGLALRGKKDDL